MRQSKVQQNSKQSGEVDITSLISLIGVKNCPCIDLHGKTGDQVTELILKGISDALRGGHDMMLITHGFNHGTVLRSTTHNLLNQFKKHGKIIDFGLVVGNPGQTLVRF